MNRLLRIFTVPWKRLYSYLYPVSYAKKIGVNMLGKVYIYGPTYEMFSTEPWLITLGDNVHITLDVKFICHDGGTLIFRKYVPDLEITKPISVGNDVYIGVRTIILPGVTIGNNCIIGAGSIVTKDIPDNSVAVGIPARVIKSTDQYLDKIKKESLHLGHLNWREKEQAIKKYYNIN